MEHATGAGSDDPHVEEEGGWMEVESDGVAGVAGSDDSHVEEEGGWMEVGSDDVVADAVRSASATDSDDRAVSMLDAESEDEEDEEMEKEGSDDCSGPLRLGMTIRNGRQAAVRFLHEQLSSCQCRCDEGSSHNRVGLPIRYFVSMEPSVSFRFSTFSFVRGW